MKLPHAPRSLEMAAADFHFPRSLPGMDFLPSPIALGCLGDVERIWDLELEARVSFGLLLPGAVLVAVIAA